MAGNIKKNITRVQVFAKKNKYWLIGISTFLLVLVVVWFGWQQGWLDSGGAMATNEEEQVEVDDDFVLEDIVIDDTLAEEEEEPEVILEEGKDEIIVEIEEPTGTKMLEVSDIRTILTVLKPHSISAQTIIDEIERITTESNNTLISGTTLVEALKDKLPKATQDKLINNVENILIANNAIRVKLKNAENIKLSFKTKKKKNRTIKIYDNAEIKFVNSSSQLDAEVSGFRYRHLGKYWKIKNLDIEQKGRKGTLDIQLDGRLKDINLPTVTLGNLYRRVSS